MAGVRHCRRTGAGQRIDISLQEALTFTNSSSIARYSLENTFNRRPGAGASGGAGANIYRCKDGKYIHFTAGQPNMWREITANWMPENILTDPEWQNTQYRAAHADEVALVLSEFIGQFTADEFVQEAQRRHLPAAPLNTIGEFIDSEQVDYRGWLRKEEHPVIGTYTSAGYPMRLSVTPMAPRRPAPLMDQHRNEILSELENTISQVPENQFSADSSKDEDPMLDGIRVADLTRQFAGPLGTTILGYYGMEVIKIESNEIIGYGESSPLPGFSIESLKEVSYALESYRLAITDLEETSVDELLSFISIYCDGYPSVEFGLETAIYDLVSQIEGKSFSQYLNPNASHAIKSNGIVGIHSPSEI